MHRSTEEVLACSSAAEGRSPGGDVVVCRVCLRSHKQVTPEDCLRCKGLAVQDGTPRHPRPDLALVLPEVWSGDFTKPTIRLDGSILYRKTGWEYPANINGYERDASNKWLFHPLWPVCDTRTSFAFVRGACGCLQVKMKCRGGPVSLEACQECRDLSASPDTP